MTRHPSTTRQRVKALEAADDAGVQVVGFDIPELVVPNSDPDYPEVEGYRLEIPAGAIILACNLTARYGGPTPDGESAEVQYRLYDDADWETGLADLSNGWDWVRSTIGINDSTTEGELGSESAPNDLQYGRELLRGILVTWASAEALLTDVAIRAVYVAP